MKYLYLLNKLSLFICFLFVFGLVNAQNRIQGTIENSEEIEGYNVITLSSEDQSIIGGSYFLDKDFEITSKQDTCLLLISSLGFSDTVITLIFSDEIREHNVSVTLKTEINQIEEVVVKKAIPVFTMDNSTLVMNVDNTALSKSGSASDVLKKSIRVDVDRNNNVSVLGKGEAVVYLDNREVKSNEVLEMISSEEIEKVEIITNPSSEYGADAKAVIKIITKKDGKLGYGAKINSTLIHNVYYSKDFNATLTHRNAKNSVYVFYAFKPQKLYKAEYYTRDYTSLDNPVYIENDIENTTDYLGHRIKVSDRYSINQQNSIEAQFDINLYDKWQKVQNTYFIDESIIESPEVEYHSNVNSAIDRKLMSGNLTYNYLKKDSDLSLDLALDYLRYKNEIIDSIYQASTLYPNPDLNFVNDVVDIYSVKADFKLPFSEAGRAKFGTKLTLIDNTGNTQMVDYNYDYGYKESISAFYGNYFIDKGKSSLTLGLRSEYTITQYVDEEFEDKNTLYLFPKINYEYSFSDNLVGSLSFSKNIERPSYRDLNPSKHYIDTLSYSQGNPFLKPEISYTADATIQYMQYASLNFNYSYLNNTLMMFAENDSENTTVTKLTQRNVEKNEVYSVNAVIPYQFPWLTLYVATGYIFDVYKDTSLYEKKFSKSQWYLQSGYSFKFPYGINFDLTFQYISGGLMGVWEYNDIYNLDVSLQKSFFDKKLDLTISVDDLFNTSGIETKAYYHNKHLTYNEYGNQTKIKVSLGYRFNVLKTDYDRNKSIDNERLRISK